ncbi:hypothetical protein BDW22DRAFT_1329630 [Trametopsis cervina]|nr:hypothetical protein BDW22DRAFT_1329630 [Trametopsis cervina]
MTDTRPVTSKARGVCRYYNTSTGCRAGNSCKFLHGEEKLTPFDKSKICKFYAAGFCKRGATCWFVHAQPDAAPTQDPDTGVASEDDVCCICIEKPTTYGLMGGCSHIFCIGCIMEWRNPRGKSDDVVASGVTKKCPLCRASSQFVTPSSHFYPEGHPHKAIAIEKYRQSTSRVPCKYFQRSPPNKRYCPFGKDCFYQHLNDDGTPYVFNEGVDSLIRASPHILRRPID